MNRFKIKIIAITLVVIAEIIISLLICGGNTATIFIVFSVIAGNTVATAAILKNKEINKQTLLPLLFFGTIVVVFISFFSFILSENREFTSVLKEVTISFIVGVAVTIIVAVINLILVTVFPEKKY